jgi:hypothetical protein
VVNGRSLGPRSARCGSRPRCGSPPAAMTGRNIVDVITEHVDGSAACTEVEQLLRAKADVNKYHGTRTALLAAAESGHSEVCALLLAWGADHDLADPRDRTALHRSVESGHVAATKVLIDHGGNPFARSCLPGRAMPCCCARWCWAYSDWCHGPTPLSLVRDDTHLPTTAKELRRLLRGAQLASVLSPCTSRSSFWRDPCQWKRLQSLGARAIAQRHDLRPNPKCEAIECCCCCSNIELLCAMFCCCQDEHFGLDPNDPLATPTSYVRPPHWIREVNNDPLIGLIFGEENVRLDADDSDDASGDEHKPESSASSTSTVSESNITASSALHRKAAAQSSSTVSSADADGIAPALEGE